MGIPEFALTSSMNLLIRPWNFKLEFVQAQKMSRSMSSDSTQRILKSLKKFSRILDEISRLLVDKTDNAQGNVLVRTVFVGIGDYVEHLE